MLLRLSQEMVELKAWYDECIKEIPKKQGKELNDTHEKIDKISKEIQDIKTRISLLIDPRKSYFL